MSEKMCNNREAVAAERIRNILYTRDITQRELMRQCQKLGYTLNQASISKVLSGNQRLTVEQLDIFSRVLDVPIESLITDGQDNSDKLFKDFNLSGFLLSENPYIDPDAFKGYDGEYQVYFLASSSTEKGKLIEARLQVEPQKDYCRAQFDIELGDSQFKSYKGQMLVASDMQAAYFFLLNSQTGEIASLYIRYRKFRTQQLMCRMGLILSSGSGDSVMPTVGNVFLTRHRIDEKYFREIAEVLKLDFNESITVSSETIEESEIKKELSGFTVSEEVVHIDKLLQMIRRTGKFTTESNIYK